MKSFTYLLINAGCFIVPFIASFYPKRPFFKEWKAFCTSNLIVALFFVIWDYFFTKAEIWGFNPEYLTGIYFLNLPLEEILFFVCIPYACVFTYFALKHLVTSNPFSKYQYYITIMLIVLFVVLGVLAYSKWYTSVTSLLTALFLITQLVKKIDMSYYYLTYILILPFFFFSNGLLTGSLIDNAIVWYDDTKNLGIRIFTIPIEDSIYGFLLIAMNIRLFDYFKARLNS